MTNAASGWGFQWFEDAKQTLKTVEKSIDKAIGIPTENGTKKEEVPQPQPPPATGFWWGDGESLGSRDSPLSQSASLPPSPTPIALPKKPPRNLSEDDLGKRGKGNKQSEDLSLEQLLNDDLLLERVSPQKRTNPKPSASSPARSLQQRADPAAGTIRRAKKLLEDSGRPSPSSLETKSEAKANGEGKGENGNSTMEVTKETTTEVEGSQGQVPVPAEVRADSSSQPLISAKELESEQDNCPEEEHCHTEQEVLIPQRKLSGDSVAEGRASPAIPEAIDAEPPTSAVEDIELQQNEEGIDQEEDQHNIDEPHGDVQSSPSTPSTDLVIASVDGGVEDPVDGSGGTEPVGTPRRESPRKDIPDVLPSQQQQDIRSSEQEGTPEALTILALQSQLQRLSVALAEREKQLGGAVQANAILQETNNKLERELYEREAKERENDVEGMKQEFSTRLGQLERSLAAVVKERDGLKRQLAEGNSESVIQEKEETIAVLRAEGEKLSKTQLKLEAVVKKLRVEEKNNAKIMATLQERLSAAESLVESKTERIKELEATHSQYSDTLHTMKEVSETAAKKLEEKDRITLTSQQRISELEAMLNRAWEEIAENKKQVVIAAERAEASVLAAKEAASLHYEALLRKAREEASAQEATLSMTIHQLRSSIARDSERAQWREEEFKKEIQTLQSRLQAAEARNEELAASVPDTTRPLLRQIEHLQALLASKQRAWEDLEHSLTNRLKEQEERASISLDKERKATALLGEKTSRVASLESKLAIEQNATVRLEAEVESQRAMVEEARKQHQVVEVQLDSLRQKYKKLAAEKQQSEEKHQATIIELKEQAQAYLATREREWKEKEDKRIAEKERASMYATISPSKSVSAVSSSWKSLPSSAALEGLHAALKQKEGELANLQALLASTDKQKCNLEDELVYLTGKNEELCVNRSPLQQLTSVSRALKVKQMSGLQGQMDELNQRYLTALELMGEKAEMVEELQADLADMKELYRNQISDLLLKIEVLNKGK